MDVYAKLRELNLTLPPAPKRGGIYKPVRRQGNLLYVSGQGPTWEGVARYTGKVGSERTLEEGREAARLCVLNALAALQEYVGDLNRLSGVVKILGLVQSADGFFSQPKVIDAASQLLLDVLGEDGVGARSAIGVSALPNNISVEIEFIFELSERGADHGHQAL